MLAMHLERVVGDKRRLSIYKMFVRVLGLVNKCLRTTPQTPYALVRFFRVSSHILLFHKHAIFHYAPPVFDFVIGLGDTVFYLQAVLCGQDG